MISFLTLFLGLIAGPHFVEISVARQVLVVEVQLDGRTIGRLDRPPWSLSVDFGPELAPHELVARALDEKGEEVGRARQWINLPRPPAEIEILLERDQEGRARFGEVAVESLYGPRPDALTAAFDRTPLAIADGRRFELPAYDPSATHLLTVIAKFPNSVQTRRDLVVGGRAVSAAASELTAVPVRLAAQPLPPAPGSLAGFFVKNGAALSVVAVEHGPAEVLIVRNLSTDEALSKLGWGGRTLIDQTRRGVMPVYVPDALRMEMRLPPEDRLRFIWPVAHVISTANPPSELFDNSHEFTSKDGGLHWLLTRVEHPARVEIHPRFADAVAVAGLQTVASHDRRAVILVVGKKVTDGSRYEPAVVRRYLKTLRVPLYVWSLENPRTSTAAAPWGEAQDISNLAKFRSVFEKLRKDLDEQWIVWLEGEHRPQDVALGPEAKGIELIQ